MIAIAFVLIAEMINSAIEHAIDVATTSFDPLAKLAKDIAAGAVLIASVNAVAVGYLVFSRRDRRPQLDRVLDRLRDAPITLTLIALVLTVLIVIATKALTGRGTPLRGGLPSGHAAVAFAGWMAVTYSLGRASTVSSSRRSMLIMALLVAQTRVEAGVHSTLEVVYGGLLGALTTLALFQLVRMSRRAVRAGGRDRGASVRAVLAVSRRRGRSRPRRAALRRRERRERRLSARRLRREDGARTAVTDGCRPGDLEAIAITASPCGGCRQWLHEFR